MQRVLLACLAALGTAWSQAAKPAGPDLTKQPTLYVVGYAHLDTQWRWEYPTTGVSTFSQAAAARMSCLSVTLTSNFFRSAGCSAISLRSSVIRSRQEGR